SSQSSRLERKRRSGRERRRCRRRQGRTRRRRGDGEGDLSPPLKTGCCAILLPRPHSPQVSSRSATLFFHPRRELGGRTNLLRWPSPTFLCRPASPPHSRSKTPLGAAS
uniref:Uncharacterized protein n=1 Tax=Triticum urartu TaxID=4572 RepID=A0A8R7PD34_TRIUA